MLVSDDLLERVASLPALADWRGVPRPSDESLRTLRELLSMVPARFPPPEIDLDDAGRPVLRWGTARIDLVDEASVETILWPHRPTAVVITAQCASQWRYPGYQAVDAWPPPALRSRKTKKKRRKPTRP
jgi:hypothetical protein